MRARGGRGALEASLLLLLEGDLEDLVEALAAGHPDLHLVPHFLPEEGAGERARDADGASLEVALVGADDAVGRLLRRLRVGELDRGAEGDAVARELGRVDHLGEGELLLEVLHAAFDEGLLVAGGVVLGVLLEVAVLAGAAPARVDGALEGFGFAMGPFAVSDLAGIDVGWRAKTERIKRGAAPPFAVSDIPDAMVAAERFGQKNGRGYYRYEPGDRKRYPDPAVDAILATERERAGIPPQHLSDEEIVERCVYALVNEGARILGEGVADSAADIDTIWINGYGFPKARGGPMRFAQDTGIANVLARIERFAERDPVFWKPAARLIEAAETDSF